MTDRPYESFHPQLDEYRFPYLDQAVAAGEPRPISSRAEHARLRARVDGLAYLRALEAALTFGAEPEVIRTSAEEEAIETGRLEEAAGLLDRSEPETSAVVAGRISGGRSGGRPGYLVLNPIGVARRAAVLLPGASPDLRPEGPLRAAQFTDEGVWAVVDLPAFGYAWVPRDPDHDAPPPPSNAVSARGRVVANASMEVEIDAATGGLRAIRAPGEDTARLGQQLVMGGFFGADGRAIPSRMRSEGFEVEYGGPALAQAVARGGLFDPNDHRRLATFRQRFRLWAGRPTLEIDVELSEIDFAWLSQLSMGAPWQAHLACRWAWPDSEAIVRRTSLLAPEQTDAERPETAEALDITARRRRTAILCGGLAHHARQGPRMLDTILLAGAETARAFRLGVALDLEHPAHGVQDFNGPAFVVPTDAGPPRTGPTGWFFRVDNRAVAATRIEYLPDSGDGRGWGLAFHLLETAGRACRCRLRLLRDPIVARQVDFHDDLILNLDVNGDAVSIDLTPFEMARIDVTLG